MRDRRPRLGITASGQKFPVGLGDGANGNKTVVTAMLADLVSRGLYTEDHLSKNSFSDVFWHQVMAEQREDLGPTDGDVGHDR